MVPTKMLTVIMTPKWTLLINNASIIGKRIGTIKSWMTVESMNIPRINNTMLIKRSRIYLLSVSANRKSATACGICMAVKTHPKADPIPIRNIISVQDFTVSMQASKSFFQESSL